MATAERMHGQGEPDFSKGRARPRLPDIPVLFYRAYVKKFQHGALGHRSITCPASRVGGLTALWNVGVRTYYPRQAGRYFHVDRAVRAPQKG